MERIARLNWCDCTTELNRVHMQKTNPEKTSKTWKHHGQLFHTTVVPDHHIQRRRQGGVYWSVPPPRKFKMT